MSNQQDILTGLQRHAPEGVTVEISEQQELLGKGYHFDITQGDERRCLRRQATLVIDKNTWDNINGGIDAASRIAELLKSLFG